MHCYLEERSLRIRKIKPDGHCLINSIFASLQSQNIYIDSSLFKQKCLDEAEMDTKIGYPSMLESTCLKTNKQMLLKGIVGYFDERIWNNDVGDILVLILANAFKIRLEIMSLMCVRKNSA